MVGILSRFLLGWPIFRGELLVLGSVSPWCVWIGETNTVSWWNLMISNTNLWYKFSHTCQALNKQNVNFQASAYIFLHKNVGNTDTHTVFWPTNGSKPRKVIRFDGRNFNTQLLMWGMWRNTSIKTWNGWSSNTNLSHMSRHVFLLPEVRKGNEKQNNSWLNLIVLVG